MPMMHGSSVLQRSTDVDTATVERSIAVDQALACLRKAVDLTGHTLDSLAAHTAKDRAYIGKVLNGDKPCSLPFECSLPEDVRAQYDALKAEQHGAIVVAPLSGMQAQKALVAGLIGLMSQPEPLQLPAKAGPMLKAEPVTTKARKRA